jgi:protein subunit release factor B
MTGWEEHQQQLSRLGLKPEQFEENFGRSAGPGGQNVNKVSTAVELRHIPTGQSVTVRDTRSQARNRQIARGRLLDQIEQQRKAKREERRQKREAKRRRNRPRPAKVKRKMLESKKRRGEKKKMRRKPRLD